MEQIHLHIQRLAVRRGINTLLPLPLNEAQGISRPAGRLRLDEVVVMAVLNVAQKFYTGLLLQRHISIEVTGFKDECLQAGIGQMPGPRGEVQLLEGIVSVSPGADEKVCRTELWRARNFEDAGFVKRIAECLLELQTAISKELLGGRIMQLRLGVDDDCLQASHQPVQTDLFMLLNNARRLAHELYVVALQICLAVLTFHMLSQGEKLLDADYLPGTPDDADLPSPTIPSAFMGLLI
jgi:hypothetical protein